MAAGNFALRQKEHTKRSDRIERRMIRSLHCVVTLVALVTFPAAIGKISFDRVVAKRRKIVKMAFG